MTWRFLSLVRALYIGKDCIPLSRYATSRLHVFMLFRYIGNICVRLCLICAKLPLTKQGKAKGDEMKELVSAVREHALANYESDGWDVVVECWEDADVLEAIGKATTAQGAINAVREHLAPLANVRADIQAEAVACGRDDVPAVDTGSAHVDHTGYSNHSQNCYESFSRGAECSCGLINWQDSETEMQALNEMTQTSAGEGETIETADGFICDGWAWKQVGHHFTSGKSLRCDACGDTYDPTFWVKHQIVCNRLVCRSTEANEIPF